MKVKPSFTCLISNTLDISYLIIILFFKSSFCQKMRKKTIQLPFPCDQETEIVMN